MRYLSLAVLFSLSAAALAAPLNLHSTGHGLAFQQVDPSWTIDGATAYCVEPNVNWTSLTGENWITRTPVWGIDPEGVYDFHTTIDLTGFDPTSAQVTVLWSSDDGSVVNLNGTQVGVLNPDDGTTYYRTASITLSQFHAGVNDLDFLVTNGGQGGSDPGPVGLSAHLEGTANPVPEPASWVALIGLVVGLNRKRRSLR